jgi:hypothetical protein
VKKKNITISKPHFSISNNSQKFFIACVKLLDPLAIDIIRNKNHSFEPLYSIVGRTSPQPLPSDISQNSTGACRQFHQGWVVSD